MDKLQDGFRGFIVPVEIFDVPDLDWKEQMVYLVLRSYCNPREATAFPSYNTIAKQGRMSRDSAIRAVKGLVEKGLLHKELRLDVSKNRKVKNTSNLYTVKTPSSAKQPKVVAESNQGSSTQQPPLVAESNQGSSTQQPEHNHLTKQSLTKQINNNKQTEKNVVVDLLNKNGIKVNKATLNKWRKLADENTILAAITDALKPGVRNVVGYINRMLEDGYTPAAPAAKKDNLPHYIANQRKATEDPKAKTSSEIDPDQRKEALDLLLKLGEISQQEYDRKIAELV